MLRHESAFADARFRVFLRSRHAADEFDARPDAAGILPTAAGTTQPFPEDGPGQHDPAFGFGQLACERLCLSGGPHAGTDEGCEEVRGDCQAGSFGDATDAAYNLKAFARSGNARQKIGQLLA